VSAPWVQILPPGTDHRDADPRLWVVRSDQGIFQADDLGDALHSAADAYERAGDVSTAHQLREEDG
jgi:hypothetical protein